MSAMSPVRSLPARPTNGMPCLSSSAPGPSPTNTRSAAGSPSPNTTWLRPWVASGHFVQASASRSSSSKDANGDSTTSDTHNAIRLARGGPEAVEVGFDGAGGQGEGDVPVEASVRREEGPAHRLMRRLGHQVAFELGEAGGRRPPHPRGVVTPPEPPWGRGRRGGPPPPRPARSRTSPPAWRRRKRRHPRRGRGGPRLS